MQQAIQHGRSRVSGARLVVLTDGRGNVSLQSSLSGQLVFPVGRSGVEDALEVAKQISALDNVVSVVLDPLPAEYTYLPHELAAALGGGIVEIPRYVEDDSGEAQSG